MKDAPRPLAAADMVLVRLAYAADLPSPDEALRRLAGGGQGGGGQGGGGQGGGSADRVALPRGTEAGGGAGIASAPAGGETGPERGGATRTDGRTGHRASLAVAPRPSEPTAAASRPDPAPAAPPPVRLNRLEDLVALAAAKRDIQLKTALERDIHLVRFDEGSIEFSLAPGAPQTLPQALMRKLREWTGAHWVVALSRDPGAPTLAEQAKARDSETRSDIERDPLVRSVLAQFPGARVVAVRGADAPLEALPPPVVAAEPVDDYGEDVTFEDMIFTEDDP